jgi:hypothetical protein
MKIKPAWYKLIRFALTGKKEGLDLKIILKYMPQERVAALIKKFTDELEKNNLEIGISLDEKDFYLIEKNI